MSAHRSDEYHYCTVENMPEGLKWKINSPPNRKGFWVRCADCDTTLYAWKGIEEFYCMGCCRRASPGEARKIKYILQMEAI